MALNLADPGAIVAAYDSIIDARNTNNWLLLQYSKFDELALLDHGSGGLRELKRSIQHLDQVHIGFYREEIDDTEPGYALINYIPPSIPAVKKARALVHSRRVGGAVFKKHQSTLTVDYLDQLTPEAVHNSLIQEDLPDTPSTTSTFRMGRPTTAPGASASHTHAHTHSHSRSNPTTDSPLVDKNKALPDPTATEGTFVIEPVRRVASEAPPSTSANLQSGAPPIIAKSSSMFSSLMRRKKKSDSDIEDNGGPPPPTPPKDDKGRTIAAGVPGHLYPQLHQPFQQGYQGPSQALVPVRPSAGALTPYEHPQRSRTGSLSELAVISHASSSGHGPDEFGHGHGYDRRGRQRQGSEPYHQHNGVQSQSRLVAANPVMSLSLPLRGKWMAEPMDAAERLRRRQEELKQRQEEEEESRKEEYRFKDELKRRKEQELNELREAEARRRASIEEELQRFMAEKRRKEKLEREEEERKKAEIEERRRVDRARRMEEHRRLEQWRNEQNRLIEEAARRTEELRIKEEDERQKKIALAEAKVKKNHNIDSLISGWVTMQTSDSLLWKRRFYKFIGTAVYFYRSPKDMQHYLDKTELRGQVVGLKEWNQGYEELEAIPYSFAIEFKDGRVGHWSMFSDSEEDKFKLLGLLHHAAGL